MKLLAIDTSTDKASVALCDGKNVLNFEKSSRKTHAEVLLPAIDKLLKEAGLTIQMLDGIVYGRGPGSFTGLRITCSIAKGLGFAHDLALYPASTLAAIKQKAETENKDKDNSAQIIALLDARMNALYWGYGTPDSGGLVEIEKSAEDMSIPGDDELIFAGVGFENYIDKLNPKLKNRLVKTIQCYPDANTMITMVQSGQIEPASASDAEPLYIRNEVTHRGSRG